jgi:signal transduction histidine kinase
MDDPVPSHPSWKSRKAAFALIAVMSAVGMLQSWHSHIAATEAARNLVSALTRASAYEIAGSVRIIDTLLSDIADRLEPGPRLPSRVEPVVRARIKATHEVVDVIIVDKDGRIVAPDLTGGDAVSLDVSDRSYFQRHKVNPPSGELHMSAPVKSRVIDRMVIPFSRTLLAADGSFAGIIAAGVDPDFFYGALAAVADPVGGSAALIMADGTLLGRAPATDLSRINSKLPGLSLKHGDFRFVRRVAEVDAVERFIGSRPVSPYPLVVTNTLLVSEAMAEWYRDILDIVGSIVVFSVAVFILALMADRREHARAELAASLAAHSNRLEQEVAERTQHLEAARAETQRHADRLAASNADLEQFAYIASHDLQEPLRMVASYAQLLDRRYRTRLDSDADTFLGYLTEGAKRMQVMIADLLDYSRVDRGGSAVTRFDSGEAAQAAILHLSPAIEEVGGRVECGELPVVTGDQPQFIRVMQNLIGNALKYRHLERPPVVRVSACAGASETVFTVADNGIGIEPEYFDKIFQIFQRLHGRDRYPGTGIGLAICKKIVERHGGRVRVESKPGEGSTFSFSLPMQPGGS